MVGISINSYVIHECNIDLIRSLCLAKSKREILQKICPRKWGRKNLQEGVIQTVVPQTARPDENLQDDEEEIDAQIIPHVLN